MHIATSVLSTNVDNTRISIFGCVTEAMDLEGIDTSMFGIVTRNVFFGQ